MNVQYLPDQVLAAAVQQPNGEIPGYLALAELQRRQKLRQGAVQPPQSTVAQQVLQSATQQPQMQGQGMHTLDSLPTGKMPQQPAGIASIAQQPTPQQQQPVPGMKCGGIVKKYAGGSPDQGPIAADSPTDAWSILMPRPETVDKPDLIPYEVARKRMQDAYGSGQDYSEELQGIRALRNSQAPLTNQQTLLLAGLSLMGTPGNSSEAFSHATLGALGAQRDSRQQAFDDRLRANQLLFGFKERSQDREDHVTDAARTYMQAENGEKLAQYRSDVSGANQAAQQKMAALGQFSRSMANPDQAAATIAEMQQVLADPHASDADKQKAQTIIQMSNATIAQQKRMEEEKQAAIARREQDLWTQRSGDEYSRQLGLLKAKHDLDQQTLNAQGQGGDLALESAAENYLLTGDSGIKGRGKEGSMLDRSARERAAVMMQQMGLRPDDLNQIRSIRQANDAEVKKNQVILGQISSYEGNIVDAIPQLLKEADKVPRTNWNWLNGMLVPVERAFSKPGTAAYKVFNSTIPAEYAKVMAGFQGQTTDTARQHAQNLLADGLSKGSLKEATDAMLQEMEIRKANLVKEINFAVNRQRLPVIVNYLKTGQYPEAVTATGGGASGRIRVKNSGGQLGWYNGTPEQAKAKGYEVVQ